MAAWLWPCNQCITLRVFLDSEDLIFTAIVKTVWCAPLQLSKSITEDCGTERSHTDWRDTSYGKAEETKTSWTNLKSFSSSSLWYAMLQTDTPERTVWTFVTLGDTQTTVHTVLLSSGGVTNHRASNHSWELQEFLPSWTVSLLHKGNSRELPLCAWWNQMELKTVRALFQHSLTSYSMQGTNCLQSWAEAARKRCCSGNLPLVFYFF